jgi:hypothetical protein
VAVSRTPTVDPFAETGTNPICVESGGGNIEPMLPETTDLLSPGLA